MRLEELVRFAEVRPLDVPMIVAGLDVKDDLIRQQGVEDVDDRLALAVFESDVDFYHVTSCLNELTDEQRRRAVEAWRHIGIVQTCRADFKPSR